MTFHGFAARISLLALIATSAVASPAAKSQAGPDLERGRFIASIGGCDDCHSPKKAPGSMEPDMSHRLAGRPATTPPPAKPINMGEITVSGDLTAWHGPWGISYSANITQDAKTGIGKRYTEAAFIKAMRTGKKPEGDPILPPMPWPTLAQLSDGDLKALFAFLKTVKPIENNVRVAVPAAHAVKK